MNAERVHSSLKRITAGLLLAAHLSWPAVAQVEQRLPRTQFRNGEATLKAFAPVSAATRKSIIKLNENGETVALGTVIDSAGFAITKSSEIGDGKLTSWLAEGREVQCELISRDEELDLALVRVNTTGLKPIQWAENEAWLGQWAITPGIADTPHAVGVVSTPARRVLHPRAFIGVQFSSDSGSAESTVVDELMPGLGAEKAGLKAGDQIVGVNGNSITNREQLVNFLREFRDGQTVTLALRRGESNEEVEVEMKSPAPDTAGFGSQRLRRINGAVSLRAEGFESVIQHDSVLQPWLCGGPLVNLEGKAIGLNIARAGRVATYALPAQIVIPAIKQLMNRIPTGHSVSQGGS